MEVIEINKINEWKTPWTEELKKIVKTETPSALIGDKLLLETESVKVWAITLPPGKSLPFHKHDKPYFYTAKNKGKSRSFNSNGTVTITEYLPHETKYFPNLSEDNYFVHNLENIGDTTLEFTTVEFKK